MLQLKNRALFIFRRDLRLTDNIGLNAAMISSKEVMAVFFIDPRQVKAHPYQSIYGLGFMVESLEDLAEALNKRGGKLYFFVGQPEILLPKIIQANKIDAIFFNKDYTPFSLARDEAIKHCAQELGIDVQVFSDALLNEPGTVLKDDLTPYTVFTPFYNKALQRPISSAKPLLQGHFYQGQMLGASCDIQELFNSVSKSPIIRGGADAGKKILKQLSGLSEYARFRDYPSQAATSYLSAHLKFGTVSIRQAYAAIQEHLSPAHPLIRQLYWRDFFYHIAVYFPHVFGHCFLRQYDQLSWAWDEEKFKRWCTGQTGFPIVDAGMRQLNATGFMHNRLRMITASFLVKDLHIDWREGEKYFATKLIDYDPCVNNGNWQWAASTGCDHQPYFRIFNPWLQQEKFDPQASFIREWIPELKDETVRSIQRWYQQERGLYAGAYPIAMLDHATAAARAKAMFQTQG